MNPVDKQRITLNIDNHAYVMYVNKEEEEIFRKAEKIINNKIMQYKRALKSGTDIAFISYATIDLVKTFLANETKADDTDFVSELRDMSSEIEEYIHKS